MPQADDSKGVEQRRRRQTLTSRLVLVTTGVAALAVLLAGLVSVRLVTSAADDQARTTLGRQADVAVGLADETGVAQQRPALVRAFRIDQITLVRVTPRGRLAPLGGDGVVTPADAATITAGGHVSAVRRDTTGRRVFVEGRPADNGGGAVLWQPARVARGATRSALGRIGLALLVGLAGAALVAVGLSRRLARPLKRAATAAHRMSVGDRAVRLHPEGPEEVAEVADALNGLVDALAVSEHRQRDFLLSVSHELRTPLTAVKGYAEALADGVVPPENVAETGVTMLGEAERLDRLVTDLLDLARIGAQDFRLDLVDVDLTDLVRQAGAVWADRCAPAGVQFAVETPDEPLMTYTDPTRVRQVIDGLAENALRATPAGAPLVIALRRDAEAAVIEVRDGGPGLTADDQRVAFERSALYDRYRGERRVGTGIGLALVSGLVGRLGGSPSVHTAPEGGAAFVIRLPLAGPVVASAGTITAPHPTPR
jgi:two-component system OmpR family sensor kinase